MKQLYSHRIHIFWEILLCELLIKKNYIGQSHLYIIIYIFKIYTLLFVLCCFIPDSQKWIHYLDVVLKYKVLMMK